jgi:hypothetical protein
LYDINPERARREHRMRRNGWRRLEGKGVGRDDGEREGNGGGGGVGIWW